MAMEHAAEVGRLKERIKDLEAAVLDRLTEIGQQQGDCQC